MLTEIGKLFHPLYHALAYLLVFWYGLVPNYAVAISLFTVTVMVVLAPLTVKSTRSMLAMQRLQPEVNKLKEKYKNDKMAMQTEMSQLFKANGINPAGGCLPMLIQLPIFIVLYKMIEGLTKTALVGKIRVVEPQYISHTSLLYKHLIAAHGAMISFGMNLAKSATSSHGSFLAALPFYGLLVVCIALQFLQMRQLSSRAPKQTGAAAQTQAVMKFMPLVFGFIYLAIPAGVNVYFFVSSLFRIGQQELMYRFDPQVRGHAEAVKEAGKSTERGVVVRGAANLTPDDAPPVGLLASLRAARAELTAKGTTGGTGATSRASVKPVPGSRPSARPARPGTASQSTGQTGRSKAVSAERTNGGARDGQRPPTRKPTQPNGAKPKAPAPNGVRPNGVAPQTPGLKQGTSSAAAKPAAAKPAAAKPAAAKGAESNGVRPNAAKPSAPNGARPNGVAPQTPGRKQGTSSAAAAPKGHASNSGSNGVSSGSARPSPRDGKAGSAVDAGSVAEATDPQSQSWARRPRPAPTAALDGGRPPARTRTQTVEVPSNSKTELSPNRSRAKRARRSR